MKPKGNRILRIIPALTARTQFGQILRRVRQNNERFVVDKRGDPQAVIMGVEEYLRVFAHRPREIETIQRASKARGLDRMSLRTINLEIKRYRKQRSQQP